MKEVRHKRKNTISFHSYETPRICKFLRTGGRIEVTRGQEKTGTETHCLMGVELLFVHFKNYSQAWWLLPITPDSQVGESQSKASLGKT
jgi:hypothetical protein